MKRAPKACHSGVCGNCVSHHWRQRPKVCRGTSRYADNCAAAGMHITERVDASTTASITYTRRPKKRTDIEVTRLRQMLQQKLIREQKSDQSTGANPRGLRG